MNGTTLGKIRDLIGDKSGIYFTDQRSYVLESRLTARLEDLSLNTLEEYYYFLCYDARRDKEFNLLTNTLTINETSFFRNPPQINTFQNKILPEIMGKRRSENDLRLRIWSAGCSTGEEPYTLAIIIKETLGQELYRWFIDILASDIDSTVISFAEKGIYSAYSLRNAPSQYKKKYFRVSQDSYQIDDQIKRRVRFRRLNLVDESQMKLVPSMDVIFCRNVLIYFEESSRKKAVSYFYDILHPGGYLFVGHSESLHQLSRAFKPIIFPGAFVYKKEE